MKTHVRRGQREHVAELRGSEVKPDSPAPSALLGNSVHYSLSLSVWYELEGFVFSFLQSSSLPCGRVSRKKKLLQLWNPLVVWKLADPRPWKSVWIQYHYCFSVCVFLVLLFIIIIVITPRHCITPITPRDEDTSEPCIGEN